jgi:hypothetical protein
MPLKTLQYELSNWQGMDRFTPETDCDPHFWHDLQNMECSDGGAMVKRTGSRAVGTTFTQTINLIYDHQSQFNYGSDTDRQRTLVVSGDILNVIKGFNSTSSTIEATFSATNAFHYAVTDDLGVSYISNANGGAIKMLAYVGSSWIYQDADLKAPSTISVTYGATLSFTLTGTFQAVSSYVDKYGNESPLSPESPEIVIANQAIDIPITVSSDPTIDYVKYYLLGPGMSDFQFSGTASNTTGTYSHTTTMAELMAGALAPSYLVPMPTGKYITMYEDMLLIGGNPTVPDSVWCSNRQFHRQWSDNVSRCVTGDGQAIMGFGDSFDRKLVVKNDSLHLCEGDYPDVFKNRIYVSKYGGVGQNAVAAAEGRMVFYSDDGLYMDNGQLADEKTRKIIDYVKTLNGENVVSYQGAPSKLVVGSNRYFKKVFISTREDADSGENDTVIVWDYLRDNFTKYIGNAPRIMGTVQNANDLEYLYGGDISGHIWQFTPTSEKVYDDTVSSTTSTTISCYAETPWMQLAKLKGLPDWEQTRIVPRYIKIYASGVPAAGSTQVHLDAKYYVDFDEVTPISTFNLAFDVSTANEKKPTNQTINYGGSVGTFKWVKWRFEHAYLGEHLRIHKMIFAFKPKPSID